MRIPLSSVSREHCEITITDDGDLNLRDLGSSNGTYRNGERVQEADLDAGDHVMIGPVQFTVVIDGKPTDIDIPPVPPAELETAEASDDLPLGVASDDLDDDEDDAFSIPDLADDDDEEEELSIPDLDDDEALVIPDVADDDEDEDGQEIEALIAPDEAPVRPMPQPRPAESDASDAAGEVSLDDTHDGEPAVPEDGSEEIDDDAFMHQALSSEQDDSISDVVSALGEMSDPDDDEPLGLDDDEDDLKP